MSLSLKNCKILVGTKWTTTNLYIDKGKIKHIGHFNDAKEVVDLHNRILMPGLIDCHVHMREPGLTHKEDFFSGSCSAVAGGVTTFLDMPNTIPTTTTTKELSNKRKLAVKSIANYGFHFGAVENNLSEIKKAKNIASVKTYLNETTGSLKLEKKSFIEKVFNSCSRIAVHAEGDTVREALKFAKTTLYVCHVPGRKELEILKKHSTKKKVFIEATPHHLFLTKEDEKELGGFGLMKPRLGTALDQKALWKALIEGSINTIATDHAPHTIKEKTSEKPPYGVPGLETMLPLLLNAVNQNKLTMQKIHELCCYNPASIFGIQNKGRIETGYDADLIIVDMKIVKDVQNELLFTKCKWSQFNGWKLQGWPIATIVNGNVVYRDGEIFAHTSGKEVIYF